MRRRRAREGSRSNAPIEVSCRALAVGDIFRVVRTFSSLAGCSPYERASRSITNQRLESAHSTDVIIGSSRNIERRSATDVNSEESSASRRQLKTRAERRRRSAHVRERARRVLCDARVRIHLERAVSCARRTRAAVASGARWTRDESSLATFGTRGRRRTRLASVARA